MNILERLIFEPPKGMFREFIGITAHLEPEDLSLYQRLLPEPFSMPGQPVVTVFVADYVKVFPWPLTRYQEWAVLLKSIFNGEEGWYVTTMPVTKWLPMKGGRYLGFPKYIVDEIRIEKVGKGWKAESKHKNASKLVIEFEPGMDCQLTAWEGELVESEAFFKGDIHLLVPPGKGPRAQKIRLQHVVSPNWSPEFGMVRIRFERGEPWAGLVPEGISFPGMYNHFKGGINLVAEKKS